MTASFANNRSNFCNKCSTRNTCRKVCNDVEKWLRRQGIRSADWIRPEVSKSMRVKGKSKWREIPFSSLSSTTRARLGI